jgi:CubicO group peptidase (beta-lactamase class C family)
MLAGGIDFLIDNKEQYRVHSVVVIRNGRTVLDARFYPFSLSRMHDIASVTKSFTSTLIGIAIDKGYIDGVHLRVLDFFPERTVANLDARKQAMTLENLLSMRSGFQCDPTNSEQTLSDMMMLSDDWVQFTLDLPMAEEPGASYVYCSPNVHLLAAILQRATGLTPLEFAREHLFRPLDIVDVVWPVDSQGINHGWGDLFLRPSDMTKLGYLYLRQGSWFDEQIVSPTWIELATTATEDRRNPDWPVGEGYGYLWYFEPDLFFAAGRGGQRVHIYPELDLVVGLNAGSGIGDYYPITLTFLDTVIESATATQPLPPDPQGVALLQAKTAEAAASDEGPPQPVPPLPAAATLVSGVTYDLEANIYGLGWIRLTFPGEDEATFEAGLPDALGGDMAAIRVGLDNINRFSPGRSGVTAAAKGWWENANQFVVIHDEIGLINLWQWTFTFIGNQVTVEMESLAGGELPATMTGTARN